MQGQTRDETEEFVARIEEIEANLEAMKRLLDADVDDEPSPKYRVLRDVYEEGGIVSRDRWQEIGRDHGYDDPRGLAGLFAHGKWVEKIMDDQVALTGHAAEELERMGILDAR
jgi:hypothetical protein